MIHVDESTVVLGIETSCDETAAAVVMGGNDVLSSVVATQIEQHARFGGVVPEIASRAHVEAMTPVVRKAMSDAGVAFERIDAVAATVGPLIVIPPPSACAAVVASLASSIFLSPIATVVELTVVTVPNTVKLPVISALPAIEIFAAVVSFEFNVPDTVTSLNVTFDVNGMA
mgnify:CR=1 FL=1